MAFPESGPSPTSDRGQTRTFGLAERVRFELTSPVKGLRFSRPVRSTTPPPLLRSHYKRAAAPPIAAYQAARTYERLMSDIPAIYGISAGGTFTLPSSFW